MPVVATPASPAQVPGTQTLERAFALLRAIAAAGEAGATLDELCACCGASPSTTYRLLQALRQQGFVRPGGARGRHVLGYELFALGARAEEKRRALDVSAAHGLVERRRARDVLGVDVRLAREEVIHEPGVAVRRGDVERGFPLLEAHGKVALEHGGLEVREVPANGFRSSSSVASAAVVVTDWPEFAELDWARVRTHMVEPAIVYDGRNALPASAVEAAGLTYMAVGRPGAHRDR